MFSSELLLNQILLLYQLFFVCFFFSPVKKAKLAIIISFAYNPEWAYIEKYNVVLKEKILEINEWWNK